MKKLLLLGVFVFVAGAVFATTTTDPATGEAQAKIIAPLVVAHADGAALNFGTLVSPKNGAGTVTISNANPGEATDSSGLERIAADPVSSDHFTVTNPERVSYSVNLPSSSINVTSGSNTMAVSAFAASCESGCTAYDIYVGGQLAVAQNQAAGEYSGEYSITLTY